MLDVLVLAKESHWTGKDEALLRSRFVDFVFKLNIAFWMFPCRSKDQIVGNQVITSLEGGPKHGRTLDLIRSIPLVALKLASACKTPSHLHLELQRYYITGYSMYCCRSIIAAACSADELTSHLACTSPGSMEVNIKYQPTSPACHA